MDKRSAIQHGLMEKWVVVHDGKMGCGALSKRRMALRLSDLPSWFVWPIIVRY